MKRNIIRNTKHEIQSFRFRVIFLMVFFIMLFGALLMRMYYLQITQHDKYQTLSEKNRVTVLPIPPNRGLIFDRNGVILADNIPTFSLHIVPEQTEDLDETLAEIDKLIGLTIEQRERFAKELTRRRRFEGVPLLVNMTEDQAATIQVNSYRLPGVNVVGGLIRHYPKGEIFAHIIGYVGRINDFDMKHIDPAQYRATLYIGKTGVEKFYESELHGDSGYEHVETDARGRVLRVLDTIEPTPGYNLYLTIDSKLQEKAEELMKDTRGAVIALDPKTGDILTLVSHPNFDPNLFVKGIDHETYNDLSTDIDQPLFNRALRGQYPPASTIKPMFALQGLETGTITTRFTISDPGYFQLPNSSHVYRDWRKGGHGTVNVETGVIESCDTFFYTLASKLGIEGLSDIYFRFGFGKPTGVDIAGEVSGLVPTPEWKKAKRGEPWYRGETVITGIGQGFTMVTPLQQAHMAATLANRGIRYQPHVVNAMELYNGDFIEVEGATLSPVYPDSVHWPTIQKAMEQVIHSYRGTAAYLSNSPYRMAGKTGTAQVFSVPQGRKYDASAIEERLRDHSLFIGYAPADDPKIAIAVIVENKSGAARIGRAVFNAYLGYE